MPSNWPILRLRNFGLFMIMKRWQSVIWIVGDKLLLDFRLI